MSSMKMDTPRGAQNQRHKGRRYGRPARLAAVLATAACILGLLQPAAFADGGDGTVPPPSSSPTGAAAAQETRSDGGDIATPATASATPSPSDASPDAHPTPSPSLPTEGTSEPPPSSAPTETTSPTAEQAAPEPSTSSAEAAGSEIAVPGAIGAEHERLGGDAGPLGPATGEQVCGLPAGGCLQAFTAGTIAWSPATGAHALTANIEASWKQYGAAGSYLAYPVAAASCDQTGGTCQQQFQRGRLYDIPGIGTFPVWGGINGTYQSLGGLNGYLGYPREAEQCGQPAGSCVQHFQRGLIYYGPGGTWQIWGAIGGTYDALGGSGGYLGYPLAAEQCGLTGGACMQRFQRGSVYFAPGAGTFPVWGAINGRYRELGGHSGYLGYPTSAERCGLRYGGCTQTFQRGRIYYAPGAGTHAVWGGLGSYYAARGAQDGALGYPMTAEACDSGGNCNQSFQFGSLQWLSGSGVRYRLTSDAYCPALTVGAVRYQTHGAARVSFAVAESYGSTRVTFITCVRQGDGSYAKEWGAYGSAGESGFAGPGVATGPTWQKYSPTGSFSVTEAFGLGNPGTALAYRTLNPFSRWGGQLNANYNKYFESSADIFPDENMWYYATRPSHDYRQGVVINYNRPPDSPIVMNAGFAIFLHGNNVPTWGCISLNDGDLLQYMRTARPGDRFVMGVAGDVFN